MIREAIYKLTQREDLRATEIEKVMDEIMSNQATEAQIAAFLIALKIKGETTEEIEGATKGILTKAVRVEGDNQGVVDLCGTGGDGQSTFNVSTISSFVAAGAGVKVAKHGNRSVSSHCGSADLLEALGINIHLDSHKVAQSIEEIGYGFLFAPLFHPAMKSVLKPRQELGIRTIFNIIGPLANPLRVKRQLLGVFSFDLLSPVAQTLQRLGTKKSLVVHSQDGLDEISAFSPTKGLLVTQEKIKELEINPEEFHLMAKNPEEIRTHSIKENVAICHRVLKGKKCVHRQMVILNAGAAIFVSGLASDLKEGIERAAETIDSGKAWQVFTRYKAYTRNHE